MKDKVFTGITVTALLLACLLAYFTGNPVLDYLAITVACASATALIVKFWKNPGKSKKLNAFAIILFALSGIFGALAGFSENLYGTIATAFLALVTVIAGLFVAKKSKLFVKKD